MEEPALGERPTKRGPVETRRSDFVSLDTLFLDNLRASGCHCSNYYSGADTPKSIFFQTKSFS